MSTSGLSNTNGLLQMTGLASGLNTNAIIQAELSVRELPLSNMAAEIGGLHAVNNQLTSIQSSLMTVSLDAQSLGDVALFSPTQSITSSNSSLVTASSTNGVGAPVGSNVIAVTALAGSAVATFNFASPAADDTLTFGTGGPTLTVPAGTTASGLVNLINSNAGLPVWAATNSAGQVILSTRLTGANQSVSVTDANATTPTLTATGTAQAGTDAQYTINGTAGTSHTDTISDASGATLTIPGTTINLLGVTGSGSPVTLTTQSPQANSDSIVKAVQQFISDYNAAIDSVNKTVNTQPASGNFNPNGGSLFGDQELLSLLSNMRQTIYTPGTGLPAGMAALSDIGITTGAAQSSGYSQTSVSGDLTLDTDKLTQAIQNNPQQVEAILQQWSNSFQGTVNNEAGPGGSLDARIQGDNDLASSLNSQYTAMQQLFAQQQKDMQQQWAQIEGTLSNLQHQTTYLDSLSALQASSSSSSSSASGG